MAKRIDRRYVSEDERRIQLAQHMFGYVFRFAGEPEPETLEAAIAAAREILALPVTTIEPPAGTDPFYIENTDWQRPPKAARAFAQQLVETVAQAQAAAGSSPTARTGWSSSLLPEWRR